LGLGTLAGLNLYLVTCMTGLAIRFDLLQVSGKFQNFEILSNPWIIGISGAMYFVEFMADKIPGLDSVWDAIHTGIRPIGAMAISLGSLGAVSTEWSILAALLAGTASATAHTAKMGTRLAANASPEPISNLVLSLAEDATVATGTILLLKYPYLTGGLCLLVVIALWMVIPRIFRKVGGVFKALRNRFSCRQKQPPELTHGAWDQHHDA